MKKRIYYVCISVHTVIEVDDYDQENNYSEDLRKQVLEMSKNFPGAIEWRVTHQEEVK